MRIHYQREKKRYTTGSKNERREKAKEQKQRILSTWVLVGTEEECLKLVQIQEKNSKRSELQLEIEEFGSSSEENHPLPIIQCVKGIIRSEKS